MTAQNAIPSTRIPANGRFHHIIQKAESVISRIDSLLEEGYLIQCACSFGKDSTVVLVLALEAIRRRIEGGLDCPEVVISHADTGVENPAMSIYAEAMMTDLSAWCSLHRLPVSIDIVKPSITASFAYRILGHGHLPTFSGASRSCSVDWKIRPQQRALQRRLKSLQNPGALISLTGIRLSESSDRRARMKARGEQGGHLVRQPEGHYVSAVIADWDLSDVWSLLMACDTRRDGPYQTFVDNFDLCLELYRDANDGACGMIAGEQANRAACGSRFGCATCLVTGERDRSMESMINSAPDRYGHLSGLNRFRNYLEATRYDLSLREWRGRKISDAGYVAIFPNHYSPNMRRDLLRYLLTLDVEEEERAERDDARLFRGELERTALNESLAGPTFQFITPRQLLAIDFIWSLSPGFDHAFPALVEWYEIRELGKRYPVPEIPERRHDPLPPKLWFDTAFQIDEMPGLQDELTVASNRERHPERPVGRTIPGPNGDRQVVWYQESDELSIDPVSATLFVDDLEDIYDSCRQFRPTDSARFYLNEGLVSIAKGRGAEYDAMARRAQYWDSLASALNLDTPQEFSAFARLSESGHTACLAALAAACTPKPAPSHTADLFTPAG